MTIINRLLSDKYIWRASWLLFIVGILLPMFTFHKFLFLNDRFSLLSGVIYLLKSKEYFLFVVVFLFSIIAPMYKLYLIGVLIKNKSKDINNELKIVKRLAVVSKWSMADVFVLAIIVSTVKLGIIAGVTVHIGLYLFGTAVLLSMLLVHRQMSKYEFVPKAEKLNNAN